MAIVFYNGADKAAKADNNGHRQLELPGIRTQETTAPLFEVTVKVEGGTLVAVKKEDGLKFQFREAGGSMREPTREEMRAAVVDMHKTLEDIARKEEELRPREYTSDDRLQAQALSEAVFALQTIYEKGLRARNLQTGEFQAPPERPISISPPTTRLDENEFAVALPTRTGTNDVYTLGYVFQLQTLASRRRGKGELEMLHELGEGNGEPGFFVVQEGIFRPATLGEMETTVNEMMKRLPEDRINALYESNIAFKNAVPNLAELLKQKENLHKQEEEEEDFHRQEKDPHKHKPPLPEYKAKTLETMVLTSLPLVEGERRKTHMLVKENTFEVYDGAKGIVLFGGAKGDNQIRISVHKPYEPWGPASVADKKFLLEHLVAEITKRKAAGPTPEYRWLREMAQKALMPEAFPREELNEAFPPEKGQEYPSAKLRQITDAIFQR